MVCKQLRHPYFEDVVIEEHVELLVRVVDAQLLEGVRVEILKPENVEDPDKLRLVFP